MYLEERGIEMLHVIENYYAISNNYGYTVVRDTGRKDKEANPVYTTLGYVGGLKEVLEIVCKDSLHNRITEGDMELKQALEFVREQTEQILKAMVGVDI